MDAFRIEGEARLAGRVRTDGSKNAALPALAAALLADGPMTFEGLPVLADVHGMLRLLEQLGCTTVEDRPGIGATANGEGAGVDSADVLATARTVVLENRDRSLVHARYDLVKTMRASISVLGPLLARRGEARVAMPGGCAFGSRPVDLHLRGLRALGAEIELEGGDIVARAGRLRGCTLFLGGPFGSTVLGTANVMSAATLAEGETVIESAACEPEIIDLARMLNAMGACIRGAGSPRIIVEGVESLSGTVHRVPPDRIVAGTLAIAAAVTNGDVVIDDFPHDHLLAVLDVMRQMGVEIVRLDPAEPADRCTVRVTSRRRLEPAVVTTQPYPGFPTDLQSQLMVLLTLAEGNSIVTEKIFPERFMHASELARMGADILREGPTAVVRGGTGLVGAPVMASDLRGSAGLVLAGLAARGTTTVSRVYHLDRGYVRLEERLNALGASIERFEEQPAGLPSPPAAERTAPRRPAELDVSVEVKRVPSIPGSAGIAADPARS